MELAEAKQRVIDRIDSLQDQLWGISLSLYENPETAFQEFKSAALLADFLAKSGFEVKKGVGDLQTAFEATRDGKGDKPIIAFLAEYDALPEIGHGCGHNLIGTAALGAGIGMLAVLDSLPGQIRVIGTPAEEGGGGKRIMVDAGVFEGIDAAMMVHPSRKNMILRGSLASMRLRVEFFGKTAHAAASPQDGINALDAMIAMFNNINALRQYLEPTDRIAGVIKRGGDVPNVIPDYTSAEFSIRGNTVARRERVVEKVIVCAEAAAQATGCTLKYEPQPGYSNIIPNRTIAEIFASNLRALGRELTPAQPNEPMGSTDMGNVSHVVPSIHPYLETVGKDVPGHTVEFREGCISPAGRATMLSGAKALAMTAVELLMDPSLLEKARSELDTQKARNGDG